MNQIINNFCVPQETIINSLCSGQQICLGLNHTLVLDNNGMLYGAGNGSHGQLGLLGIDKYAIILRKNTEKGEAVEKCTAFIRIPTDMEVKQIACGEDFSAVLDSI